MIKASLFLLHPKLFCLPRHQAHTHGAQGCGAGEAGALGDKGQLTRWISSKNNVFWKA